MQSAKSLRQNDLVVELEERHRGSRSASNASGRHELRADSWEGPQQNNLKCAGYVDAVPNTIRNRGFSLVELLVALVFTSILISGMATVFRSSMSAFTTSSETLANSRRNLLSMGLLYDDLNVAGMLPTSLMSWPASTTSATPPFQVMPNQPYSGTDVPTAQASADQLCFYYDDVLPFQGFLKEALPGVLPGQAPATQATISFRLESHAQKVVPGMVLLTRAGIGFPRPITHVSVSGPEATVTFGSLEEIADPTLSGSGGKFSIPDGSEVLIARPARYVRYSVQGRATDPEDVGRMIPCLVREEVPYGRPFVPSEPGYSITTVGENVRTLKVYLSANGGRDWAGLSSSATTWDAIVDMLNKQLAKTGRPGFQSVPSGSFWFREIPLSVRLDVTTRTVRKRQEYSTSPTAGSSEYREQTHSLVVIPRHFGLPYGRSLTNA